MALLIQQTVAAKQAITAPSKGQTKLINTILATSALISALSLSACQTAPIAIKTSPAQTSAPQKQQPTAKQPVTVTQAPIVKGDDNKYSTVPTQPTSTMQSSEAEQVYTPATQSPIITQPDSQDAIILTPSREDYILSEPSIPSHNELLERARQNSQQRSQ